MDSLFSEISAVTPESFATDGWSERSTCHLCVKYIAYVSFKNFGRSGLITDALRK